MSISRDQLRATAFYEWRRNIPPSMAVSNINGAMAEDTLTVPTMHCWFSHFVERDTIYKDEPRLERPHTVEDSAILAVVKEDQEVSTRTMTAIHPSSSSWLTECAEPIDPSCFDR